MNAETSYADAELDFAPMGPRSHERGNFPSRRGKAFRSSASMGPRSHERGNAAAIDAIEVDSLRFNGAAFS